MKKTLIVSKIENIEEYSKLAREYDLGFEYNDFFIPDLLDDEKKLNEIIERYLEAGVPDYCTMHGVFFDIIPFSSDAKIREVSKSRMEQSMQIASKIGARGVVFHTNVYPLLCSEIYDANAVKLTSECLKELLVKYSDIDIYLENMFDDDAHIMVEIAKQLKDYSNFGLCLDYAHAMISPTDIDEWVRETAPYVKHVHINDNDLVKDSHLPVGDGSIDWDRFMEYHDQCFSDCTILIETTLPENQRKSLEFLNNKYMFTKKGD